MQLVLVIAFGFVGGWLADISDGALGFGLGALIGYLLWQLRDVKARLKQLEATRKTVPRAAPPETVRGAPEAPPEPRPAMRAAEAPRSRKATETANDTDALMPAAATSASLVERSIGLVKQWLTSGNVPVKLGVIVSFFGVAFLLKYAVERQLLVVPIEVRLLGVTAVALVLLALGWRLRKREAVYALSLQGGGIGILFLTIFAAYRLYGLLPAALAFGLLVVLTAASGVLAVLQNAQVLAVLGSVGGFLAPVLVSTGQGSHVALFSYYLLLNASILGISWYRAWRFLNLIGFAFTFGIGTAWGYRYYRAEFFASTEPFLILFFLFYQAIAVLFALRQPPNLRGLVDGTILFGTPVIAFALQAQLVENTEYGLAISAVVAALFYILLATWLFRRHAAKMRLLIESYTALGVAFATLAIPLALDERWTAAAWALEGAALVWVGVRQSGWLARASGVVLLIASGAAFVEGDWQADAGLPILNGNVLGGWLIALSSLFASFRLLRDSTRHVLLTIASVVLLLWGLVWWFGTGLLETVDRLSDRPALHVMLVFIASSSTLLAWFARREAWVAAQRATLTLLPVLCVVGLLYLLQFDHLLEGYGAFTWLVAAAAHFYVLKCYERDAPGVERLWHVSGALLMTLALATEVYWRIDTAGLSDTWAGSGVLLLLPLVAWLLHWLRPRVRWPLESYSADYRSAAALLLVSQLLLLISAGLDIPGDPAPLPYLPLLNPLDALTVLGLITALRFLLLLRTDENSQVARYFHEAIMAWCAIAFVLTTISVVRAMHHLAGVPWTGEQLLGAVSVQSALSIYWGILAFAGMIIGTRRQAWLVWVIGTVLMALVVAKLFLIDLGNTGSVARIVSFLGVGGLLLVVGYFAPAPPRRVLKVGS